MSKLLIAASLLLAAISTSQSQTVKPPGQAVEAKEPFSYYLVPSDEVGFMDSPQGFQITYDGALNNGFGELDLQAGSPPKAVNQRVKTLFSGYMPIVEYSLERDGAKYQVQVFGLPYKLDPREDLLAYMRVSVSNPGTSPIHATIRAAFGPRGPIARTALPCRPWYLAKFMNAAAFKAGSGTGLRDGMATKNRHLIYLYSGSPKLDPGKLAVEYDFDLGPGQSKSVELKMPFVPIDETKTDEVGKVQSVTYDDAFGQVLGFWTGIFNRALNVEVADPKVTDTMRASLAYDLMARDVEKDGKHFTQTVNKFQYHDFYMRDTSFIARSYEMLNLPDIARTTVEHYLVRDDAGRVVRFMHNQPDDWGQSLWALGAYLRTTGDSEFAKEIQPAISAHLDGFVKATSGDPLGLWPVAGPYDNELINGHYTSHNLWALLGLREAENICRMAGDSQGAARATVLYDKFYKVFLARLTALTARAEGYIPPGMDDPNAGYDWENASGGVYPFSVLPPENAWVTATVNMEREYKYREGIMTWGPNAWMGKQAAMKGADFDPLYLHDYDTFQVDEALLARGEQRKVVEDLYSTLVHTSSTHAGFETSIRPWGDRDPGGNYPPHGWFAARYNELVRNMLVREVGNDLHIASALPPSWIEPGKTVRVRRALTNFGVVNYTISSTDSGAEVTFDNKWRKKPAHLIFHIPWYVTPHSSVWVVSEESGGGAEIPALTPQNQTGGEKPGDAFVEIPPDTRKLTLRWSWTKRPDLSYAKAVQLWLHKAYSPNPGEDTDHLFPTPTRPGLADMQSIFIDSYEVKLMSRSGIGTIYYTLEGTAPTVRSAKYSGPIHIEKTTRIRAVEVWPDGQIGPPLDATITKQNPHSALLQQHVLPGVEYSYFEGNFEAMPDFSTLKPVRIGIAPVVDLESVPHRPENFAFTFSAVLRIPTEGIYTFYTGSDDGSKLWVDGQLIVDNDGAHAYSEVKGQMALAEGMHLVRVSYFDAGGANSLHMFWSGREFKKERIPASAWFHWERK